MITLRGMEKLIVTTYRMPRVDFPVRRLRIRSGETLLDNYDNCGQRYWAFQGRWCAKESTLYMSGYEVYSSASSFLAIVLWY